jgi:RimJ/RimL family protein N-acetyltransferase
VGELPIGEPVDATPAGRPGRGTRRGRFVTLSPVEPSAQAGGLFEATREAPEVWTYLGYGPFDDEAAMRAWLESLVPQEDPLFLTVTDRVSGSPVGVVAFMNVDPPMRRLELGHIWYAPVAQRTRANTETVYLMLGEAFDDLGHRRVEWKCDALNARSRSAAERLGFTFEGVFRQHMVVKGRNRDTAWFSMLDWEWPRVRANMQQWLEAEPGVVSLRALNAAP